MKKKFFGLMLAACLTVSGAAMLSGCNGEKCDHIWQITRQPTVNVTGELGCHKCGNIKHQFPALNQTDYEVSGTNPDYKIYTYTLENETFEFRLSNFDVRFDSDTNGYAIDEYYGSSTTVVIPETLIGSEGELPVTILSNSLFENKTNLTSITLPTSLKKIESSTFSGCTSLSEITFPETLESISNYAFQNCTSLTNVVIPNSVTRIGYSMFEGCTGLQKLTVPFAGAEANAVHRFGAIFGDPNTNDSVPSGLKEVVITGSSPIQASAFEDCTNLEKVVIGNSITTIKNYAFRDCTALEEVIIGNSVQVIEACVFEGCESLEAIVIPASVTQIGNAAFYECDALETVYYKGTKTQWNDITIGDYNDNNHKLNEATRYYYSETQPTVVDYLNNNKTLAWHYDSNNAPQLWQMNFTNEANNKTFVYSETEVTISNEYWTMLQSAKQQEMLEMFFGTDQVQIEMVETSETKAEYESKLATFAGAEATGFEVSFANGYATLSQGSQSATPLEYIEVENEIYYTFTKTKAFVIDGENLYEEKATEYITTKHIYVIEN